MSSQHYLDGVNNDALGNITRICCTCLYSVPPTKRGRQGNSSDIWIQMFIGILNAVGHPTRPPAFTIKRHSSFIDSPQFLPIPWTWLEHSKSCQWHIVKVVESQRVFLGFIVCLNSKEETVMEKAKRCSLTFWQRVRDFLLSLHYALLLRKRLSVPCEISL